MPHFIRTRLFEKAPFFVLIDRTTGGAKLKKASNIKGFRIKDNSVRPQGRPSRAPVQQALSLLGFQTHGCTHSRGFSFYAFVRCIRYSAMCLGYRLQQNADSENVCGFSGKIHPGCENHTEGSIAKSAIPGKRINTMR